MIISRVMMLVCGIWFSVQAVAAGLIETATGQVRAGPSAVAATAAAVGQRITAGTTVTTGARSRAVLRFDDGQAIVLNENSEFRVTQYSFIREQPAKDSFRFELIKGALRSVTAAFTRRTPRAYALNTGTATMGIRGTDFMVAIVNPVYFRVLSGAVEVFCSDNVPSDTFGAGLAGIVANAKTCAVTIQMSQLPPEVAATFNDLAGLVVLVDASSVGATLATTAAEGSITMPVALGIAGAIAVGIAAASSGGGGVTGTTGTR